jgi:hypothetical protein
MAADICARADACEEFDRSGMNISTKSMFSEGEGASPLTLPDLQH